LLNEYIAVVLGLIVFRRLECGPSNRVLCLFEGFNAFKAPLNNVEALKVEGLPDGISEPLSHPFFL